MFAAGDRVRIDNTHCRKECHGLEGTIVRLTYDDDWFYVKWDSDPCGWGSEQGGRWSGHYVSKIDNSEEMICEDWG